MDDLARLIAAAAEITSPSGRLEALGFAPADILLPKGSIDRWAVIACDQYSSQPEYWHRANELVGGEPSTLKLIIPEAFLEEPDIAERQRSCADAMGDYLHGDVFRVAAQSMVYVERSTPCVKLRRGLVGALDLELYDYNAGSTTPIRATEGTILHRLPPRVAVRRHAPLECPHIMVLIDDPAATVVEPLTARKHEMATLYEGDLMQGAGHIAGYRVDEKQFGSIADAIQTLKAKGGMTYAVGDGNHSLATAKACWEELKSTLSAEARQTHPARWALVELVNVHDAGLQFHPIHRVVFHVDDAALLAALLWHMNELGWAAAVGDEDAPQTFEYACEGGCGVVGVRNSPHPMAVGTLQAALDAVLKEMPGATLDYVHGDDTAQEMGRRAGNMAFLLEPLDKGSLFPMVERLGALPRKAFSMGEADEKRFYLECRAIRPTGPGNISK